MSHTIHLKHPAFRRTILSFIACIAVSVSLSGAEQLIYSNSFDNSTGDDLPLATFDWNVEGEPTNYPISDGEITLVWNAVSKADNFDPNFDPDAVPGAIFSLESEEAVNVSRLFYTEVVIDRPENDLSRIVFWTSTFSLSVNYDMHVAVRVGDFWYASKEELASDGWIGNDEWYEIEYDVATGAGWVMLEANLKGGYDMTSTEVVTLPSGDITATGVIGYRDSTQWNGNLPRWGGFRIDNFEIYTVEGGSVEVGVWDDLTDMLGWKATEIGWIWDGAYPHAYSLQAGSWIYVAQGDRDNGYYFWDYGVDQWMWTKVDCSGWVYSFSLQEFVYFE